MRTTLAIDDDVLLAVKAQASRERRSVGEVMSALARQALRREPIAAGSRNGIPLLAPGPDTRPVTLELVNALRDELP